MLRTSGAKIGKGCRVYPTARIWAPWNLSMEDGACLGDWVDCYNVAPVQLGRGATVSQYVFLCTASHDHSLESHPLVTAPISVGDKAWVCADVFVAPGIQVGEGAVVSARSVLLSNASAWRVWGGHPATELKERVLRAGR